MYIPKPFQITQTQALEIIEQYPFATLCTSEPLQATHIPLQLQRLDEKHILKGHLAAANAHKKYLDNRVVMCIFTGPHAYISGSDYETTPAVPTWNYAAVHVYGHCNLLDKTANESVVREMLSAYEPRAEQKQDIYEASYIEKLSKAIVGFEIAITHIEGKAKLGQNKSIADRNKLQKRLSQSNSLGDRQMAEFSESFFTEN